jgi:hypothetical protein
MVLLRATLRSFILERIWSEIGPKAKSKDGRSQSAFRVKLTNHEEDADQPFLRINEVARTVGA